MPGTTASPTEGRDGPGIPSRDFVLVVAAPLTAALARVLAPVSLEPHARLVWVLALVPVFLLTRHRGWPGAGAGLLWSGGAVLLAELMAAAVREGPVDWLAIGVLWLALASVALGAGFQWQWWDAARPAAPDLASTGGESGPLGRLPDRPVVEFLLAKAFAGARREPPLAIVLLEIDRLEEYASVYGRESADQALALLADVLARHTRSMNVFGRWGPQACLVVLQGEDLAGAHAFSQRIREEMERYPAPWKGRVHLNAGVAAFEAGLEGPRVLLEEAEKALVAARGMGGSRVVVFVGAATPEPHVPGMVILRPGGKVKEIHRTV